MIIFIDESGIHSQDGHSSVALVYVVVEDLQQLDATVTNLEKELGISSFHWSRHNWKIRYEFFERLISLDFSVKAAILHNPFTPDIFETAIRGLLTERKIKSIIIDGKKNIKYALRLKKILREHHISAEKIRMGNDMAFPGLRVADAFAGLIRYHADQPENADAKRLYEMAKIKVTTLAGGPVSG